MLEQRNLSVKKLALAILLLAALVIGAESSVAQTTTTKTPTPKPGSTPVATTSGPSNSSQGTLFVCSNQAVLTFTGTSLVCWDIFYQIFSGSSGSGTAITGVRHVPVAGVYNVTDDINYNSGVTVGAGGSASAKVDIARETDPSKIDFSYVLTDVQDGCNVKTNASPSGTQEASSGSSSGSTATNVVNFGVTTNIFAPNGGTLNPNLSPEAAVVIGPRPSDRFRSQTPGLIFAQCDAFALAEPGIVYDNDTVTIFWSWFTKTRKEMDDELTNAIYVAKLNTADLPMTTRTEPVLRDGNFWVFYTATVGNLRPGHYEVGFLHTWANPVNDGYNDYGPGTARSRDSGNCNFNVTPNPDNKSVTYSGMYFPTNFPTHDLPTPAP